MKHTRLFWNTITKQFYTEQEENMGIEQWARVLGNFISPKAAIKAHEGLQLTGRKIRREDKSDGRIDNGRK